MKKVALFKERSNSKENADGDVEVLSPLVPRKKSYAAAVAHRERRPLARILAGRTAKRRVQLWRLKTSHGERKPPPRKGLKR